MNINNGGSVEKVTRVPSSDTGSEPCRGAGRGVSVDSGCGRRAEGEWWEPRKALWGGLGRGLWRGDDL